MDVPLLESRILKRIEDVAGKQCLKYIDITRLQTSILKMKQTESDGNIFELLTSELIIFSMSKNSSERYGRTLETEVDILSSESTILTNLNSTGFDEPAGAYALPKLSRNDSFNKQIINCGDFSESLSYGRLYNDSLQEASIETQNSTSVRKKNKSIGKKSMKSHSTASPNLSDNNSSKANNDWVKSHSAALYEIFPNFDKNRLHQRCIELNYNNKKFVDLLNELTEDGAMLNEQFNHVVNNSQIDNDLQLAESLQLEDEVLTDIQVECSCCFNEYPKTEMLSCDFNKNHLFCCECIRRYANVEIGKAKYEFACLSGSCPSSFPLGVLYNVLESKTFEKMLNHKQEAEIQAAGIENLESCPFCPFAVEFDKKASLSSDHTTLRCDNPECGKASCRLCKKVDHRPAKCDENNDQKDVRKLLENEMTEAMVSSPPTKKTPSIGTPKENIANEGGDDEGGWMATVSNAVIQLIPLVRDSVQFSVQGSGKDDGQKRNGDGKKGKRSGRKGKGVKGHSNTGSPLCVEVKFFGLTGDIRYDTVTKHFDYGFKLG